MVRVEPGVSRGVNWGVIGAFGFAAVLAALVCGSVIMPEAVPGIVMPGPVVEYGLTIVRVLLDLASAIVVGLSVLPKLLGFDDLERTEPVMRRVRTYAVGGAWLWAITALFAIVFYTAELNPGAVPTPGMIAGYLGSVGTGQGLLFTMACALAYAGIGLLAVRFGEKVPAELRIVVALFGLLPIPVTGHAVDSVWHDPIMISMELHVMGSAVWAGGLLAVMAFLVRDRVLLAIALPAFSRLATVGLVLVGLSGLVSGLGTMALTTGVRLPADIFTSEYGLLLVAKVVLVGLLVPLAANIRFRLMPAIRRLEGTSVAAWAVTEVAVMGLSYGVAVTLTRAPIA